MLNDTSKAVMDDLLKFESDCMTIQIIYNSIGNKELVGVKGRESERKKYINNLGKCTRLTYLGYLYPGRDKELTAADSLDKLREALKGFEYEAMINQVQNVFG